MMSESSREMWKMGSVPQYIKALLHWGTGPKLQTPLGVGVSDSGTKVFCLYI